MGEIIEVLDEIHNKKSIDEQNNAHIQPTADMIAVKNLVCRTPDNGKVLFDNISFSVKKGEPLIVMGPSGSGKTSLLRVIGGLWPFEKGMLFKPSKIGRNGIFFLPQRVHNIKFIATAINTPHVQMNKSRDSELIAIPKKMTEHSLYLKMDWMLVSMATCWRWEQQRAGFARLFYHRPRFYR